VNLFSELPIGLTVYGYMKGEIFKLFGVVILIFQLFLTVAFFLSFPRLASRSEDLGGSVLFFGFVLLSTLIAVGLIRLHRWAAVTASALGLIWSLAIASLLGQNSDIWRLILFGMPVITGMLLPLYVTLRNWSSLKPLENLSLRSSGVLRSSDRPHPG
jgi:hypothetical protein